MSKYTPEIVAVLRSVEGPFNLAVCQELAQREDFQEAGITAKGIISKVRSMGLDYEKVERVSKAGKPVMRKFTIVRQIEERLGARKGSLSDLSKSSKLTLELVDELVAELTS